MKRYRFYCLALLMAGTLGGYAQEEAATDTVTAARPASPIKKNCKDTSGQRASVRCDIRHSFGWSLGQP